MRRPFIYPHRSTRMLPLMKRRFIGGAVAAAVLTGSVWYWLDSLVLLHNALAFTLADLAGLRDIRAVDTVAFGRIAPVIVSSVSASPAVAYGTAAAAAVGLIALAAYAPLARGIVAFMIVMLAASAVGAAFQVATLSRPDTFPIVWTHSEMLVWLVLPSMGALLFVTAQPSWPRGVGWMIAIEAFAILWSAARLVVLLGVGYLFGAVVLPMLWFVWGLLADVVYVTTFYSIAVHVNLRLTPERRTAWSS